MKLVVTCVNKRTRRSIGNRHPLETAVADQVLLTLPTPNICHEAVDVSTKYALMPEIVLVIIPFASVAAQTPSDVLH